jgi:glyoxylase-like metal-dependent hydrolase (beta-lactamase superfamily II)/8-oxo-dGTP pyrophosphatase MutT (NUDIX family)
MPSTAATPDAPPATARAAATIVVLRDAPGGPEVLLSRRAEGSDYTSGAWVFPGGTVDRADRDARAFCDGLDDAAASARLAVAEGGLDFWIAAIREAFEESGLLFATRAADPGGPLVALDGKDAQRLAAWRGRLHRREATLSAFCREEGLRLACDRLVYLSWWLTPPGRPKRFDTRFFVAFAPDQQVSAHDGTELVEQLWLGPAEARGRARALKLLTPTETTLASLERFASAADAVDWARSVRSVPRTMPHMGTGSRGLLTVLPSEPAHAELGRIDPLGHGTGSYEIVPGRAVRLSERVTRVTAPNPSVMTGPGTNSYLVAMEGGDWTVIDPGPAIPSHVDALVAAAAPGRIRRILVTHTHTDHSPGAAPLRARTGAEVIGRPAGHTEWQDTAFAPDRSVEDGERFVLGPAITLVALRTPGHASNHVCWLLEEERLLFTGDHVMQASTVVINPPDGDMRAYLRSLEQLVALDLAWLAPGHGFLMAHPSDAMRAIVAHRLKREAKVVAAMRAAGPATLEALLPAVYDDVDPKLHRMAARSLEAHLLKLRDDARADGRGGVWRLRDGA